MYTKSKLLSAVSGMALSVATIGYVSANVGDINDDVQSTSDVSHAIARQPSALAEFVGLVNGELTGESVENALRSMYGDITREQAEKLPDLLVEIRRLGLGKQVDAAAVETMGALIAESSVLASDPDYQLAIAGVLVNRANGPIERVRVAAGFLEDDLCIYDPTDPQYRSDPDCCPYDPTDPRYLSSDECPPLGAITGTPGQLPQPPQYTP